MLSNISQCCRTDHSIILSNHFLTLFTEVTIKNFHLINIQNSVGYSVLTSVLAANMNLTICQKKKKSFICCLINETLVRSSLSLKQIHQTISWYLDRVKKYIEKNKKSRNWRKKIRFDNH